MIPGSNVELFKINPPRTGTKMAMVKAVASPSTPLFKAVSTTWRFSSAASPSPFSSQSSSTPSLPPSSNPNLALPELQDASAPTRVSFSLSYEFANPLHADVSAAFFGKVSGLMIEAFEKRCQDIYGKR